MKWARVLVVHVVSSGKLNYNITGCNVVMDILRSSAGSNDNFSWKGRNYDLSMSGMYYTCCLRTRRS